MGHWYKTSGEPCYFVPTKDGSRLRDTTIADARKMGLLPSVTEILKVVLDRPALTDWKIRTAVTAVLTSPRVEGEELDAFVARVLDQDREQDQEADIAKSRGTQIHDALDKLARGEEPDAELRPWVMPAWEAVVAAGPIIRSEFVLVGDGYAGKCDLQQQDEATGGVLLRDWKSCKTMPKSEAWFEHRCQMGGYSAALWRQTGSDQIRTSNVYISTVNQGEFKIIEHAEDWRTLAVYFNYALGLWSAIKAYTPKPMEVIEPAHN